MRAVRKQTYAGDFSRTCCKTLSGFNPTRRDRAQLLWTQWSANTLSIASTHSHTLIYFETPLTCSSLCLMAQNHRMQYTTWRQYPILQDSKVSDYSANVLQGANEIENNRERERQREVEMLLLAVVKTGDCCVCVCVCVHVSAHTCVDVWVLLCVHVCDLVRSLSWTGFTAVERFMGCYKTLLI